MESILDHQQKQSLITQVAAWYFRDFPWHRGRAMANRLFGSFLQIKVFDGFRLRLINPLEYHQWMLLCNHNGLEPDVTQLISVALKPGMVLFDVGANLGYYTLLASARVGGQGQVHAFEPAPVQFRHLELNTRLNQISNVTLNNCALAESSVERELCLSEGWNQGTHSFGKTSEQTGLCRVSCLTLDEYVSRTGVAHIDVMKVDVEGAELLVFRGGEKVFSLMPPRLLMFEACEHHAQALGTSTADVKKLLAGYGYSIYRLEPDSLPVPVSISSAEEYANLVAVHSSAEGWGNEVLSALLPKEQGASKEWTV